jgi:hypothetical protein
MRRALSALTCTALLALAPACDSEETVGDDFRSSLDQDIQMHPLADEGGGDDGTIVWEIVQAEVFDGPAAEGNLLLYIENNAIYTSGGVQTCQVNSPFLNSTVREVIAANGTDVLFTVWGNYVFQGEIDVKYENFGQIKKLFGAQLLFQYEPTEIYYGEAADGMLLMTTNTDITVQSDGRKLLMAALITGECGSPGLPGYTF